MQKMLIVAGLICAMTTGGLSQSQDPAWLDELRSQIVIEKACKAIYFLNLNEFQGPLGLQQQARVQCEDGRMFDAERFSPDENFKITICGTQVCSNEAGNSVNTGGRSDKAICDLRKV